MKFEAEELTQICYKICARVDEIRGPKKKKKEKTGKKIYEYISFLTKDCNSCIGLKRVRCISCFCVPSNVVSTALNEYPRELFRFVIRFLFAVSFTFVYFTMCWNMESVPVTRSIIFEHREIYSTSSVTVTFPRLVKEPWNLYKMKLRRKEKACRIGNVNVRYLVIEVAAGYSSCFFFFLFSSPAETGEENSIFRFSDEGSGRTLLKQRQFIIPRTYVPYDITDLVDFIRLCPVKVAMHAVWSASHKEITRPSPYW